MPVASRSSTAAGRNKRAATSRGLRKAARKEALKRKTVVPRNVVATGIGLPKKILTTHKYCDQVAINTGATGQLANYFWSCNSMYDPNRSGTGHQPMYYDQYIGLYDHYTVIGAEAKFTIMKTDSNSTIPVMVGCFVNDDTIVTPSSGQGLAEQTLGKYRYVHGQYPKTVFKVKWSAKKTFGKGVLANNSLQGSAGGNPTEEQFFQCFIDSSASITQTSVLVDVEIKYICMWCELKDQAQS